MVEGCRLREKWFKLGLHHSWQETKLRWSWFPTSSPLSRVYLCKACGYFAPIYGTTWRRRLGASGDQMTIEPLLAAASLARTLDMQAESIVMVISFLTLKTSQKIISCMMHSWPAIVSLKPKLGHSQACCWQALEVVTGCGRPWAPAASRCSHH